MDSDDTSSSSSSSSAEHSQLPSPASSSAPAPKRKAGRKKFRETRHPVYRGVRRRDGGKWVCEVRQPNGKARLWLGTYPNPEMAARAHDVAALALCGASAPLNFPDLAAGLPRPRSASHADIRRAAAEAAEMFGPRSGSASPKPKPKPEEVHFVDEEALFNMPGLLREMAEGLMLAPPAMQGGGGGGFDWDGTECCDDHMDLWSNN